MRIKYCRKINNSWHRHSGIQAEIADVLSGRISKNIFMRHYYIPSLQYKQDVLDALHRLKKQIVAQ
jgi:intergrase/recombinase